MAAGKKTPHRHASGTIALSAPVRICGHLWMLSPSPLRVLSVSVVGILFALCATADGEGQPAAAEATPLFNVEAAAPLPPETAAEAAARHAKVAKRRAGTAVICHRGAMEMATQNTLSAYRAAMEAGADGLEIDFRRTRDGILVMFHDEGVDGLLDAFGRIPDFYHEELLLHRHNSPQGLTAPEERVPTFRATLALARQHAALLHLDIKEPGIDAEVLRALRDADMLDHVVSINHYNSETIRQEARIRPLPYKKGLDDGDCDPEPVRAALELPGQMVMLDDPRLTLTELGRPASPPKPAPPARAVPVAAPPVDELLNALFEQPSATLPPRLAAARLVNYYCVKAPGIVLARVPPLRASVKANIAWTLGMAARYRPETITAAVRSTLLHLLDDADPTVRAEAAWAVGRAKTHQALPTLTAILDAEPACARRFATTPADRADDIKAIRLRAAAAWALGQIGQPKPEAVAALRRCIEHRGLHFDIAYHALDGAMAARALGELKAASAVPGLARVIQRDDPLLEPVVSKRADVPFRPTHRSWWDFRLKMEATAALGAIGTAEARRTLEAFLAPPEAKAQAVWPSLQRDAAEALCGMKAEDSHRIVTGLLAHPQMAVRRVAILACLRSPTPARAAALKATAPWATPWLP